MDSKLWRIGRKKESKNMIVLSNDTISSLHATLKFEDGLFFLKDENSTNGTYVIRDGNTETINNFIELYPDDIIIFGDLELSFENLINKIPSTFSVNKDANNQKFFKNIKKIRCLQCMKPIDSNKPCPSCNSTKHLNIEGIS